MSEHHKFLETEPADDSILKSGKVACLLPALKESAWEQNLTSSFLATLISVNKYSEKLLHPLCNLANNKNVSCEAWVEVTLKKQDPAITDKNRPDGLLIIKSGTREWKALIEAKVDGSLEKDQLERYLKLARKNEVDALITIANQYTICPDKKDFHPLRKEINGKLLQSVDLYHWSWGFLISQAFIHLRNKEIKDTEQTFILKEFLRFVYKKHPKLTQFKSMNDEWQTLCNNIRNIKPNDNYLNGAISSWHEYMRFLSLGLSESVGVDVSIEGAKNYEDRMKADINNLKNERVLEAVFHIPQSPSKVSFKAFIENKKVEISIKLPANKNAKRASATLAPYLNWLKANTANHQFTIIACWGRNIESPIQFSDFINDEYKRNKFFNRPNGLTTELPKEFIIRIDKELNNDFQKKFVQQTNNLLVDFYTQIVQNIQKAWTPNTLKGDVLEEQTP